MSDPIRPSNRILIPASSQEKRWLKALQHGYAKPDDRSLDQRLAYLVEYAENLHYYDQTDTAKSAWRPFVENDPTILLAVIIHYDFTVIDRLFAVFDRLEEVYEERDKKRLYMTVYREVDNVTHVLDRWYFDLTRLRSSRMAEDISDAVRNELAPSLQWIEYLLQHPPQGVFSQAIPIKQTEHSYLWKAESETDLKKLCRQLLENSGSDPEASFREEVKKQYALFNNTMHYLVNRASMHFQESLKRSDHPPHTALLIGFHQLMERAQAELNDLTQRHLDLYYRGLLKQKERSGTPDHAYVTFGLAQGVRHTLVPEGTELMAGKDASGNEIHFVTNEDLVVNRGKIHDLKTVFVDKNPLFSVGTDVPIVANVYASPQADSRDGLGQPLQEDTEGWPTFGRSQFDARVTQRSMPDAPLGFILAAPALALAEGDRQVTIRFTFERWDLVGAEGFDLPALLQQIMRNHSLSQEAAVYKVFHQAFRMFATGKKGWFELPRYEIAVDLDQLELSFSFALHTSDPAWMHNPELSLGEFGLAEWPMLRVELDNNAPVYAYSFLNGLEMAIVTIDAQVDNLFGLQLYNQIGLVAPDKPFQPFGPIPKVGDYLMIGNREMAAKQLTEVNFHLDWQGLPALDGGFEAYYQAYGLGIDNTSFQVQLSALTSNRWKPTEDAEKQLFQLFETLVVDDGDGPQTRLQAQRILSNIRLDPFHLRPRFDLSDPLLFGPYTQAGFFKLELCSPQMGFGHEHYPLAMASITTVNARKKLDLPLPRVPYVPWINRLSASYRSSDRLVFSHKVRLKDEDVTTGQFFHIHPFGLQEVFRNGKVTTQNLIPSFDREGYLFIGLQDLELPDTLTLYFQLKHRITEEINATTPTLLWEYLRKDQWEAFSKDALVYDSTNGFSTSGIVKLALPEYLTEDHTVLPSGRYWIRVSVEEEAMTFPPTKNIDTQAVQVTWKPKGDHERLRHPLPPNSIKGVAGKLPDVQSVKQPMRSFGGRAPETKEGFYSRVSERLRHKQRAVTSWDYERMVLEQFPRLFLAKSTRMDVAFRLTPGEVTMVVVPYHNGKLNDLPMAHAGMLNRVRDFLEQYTSPFAQIQVRNPKYEALLVNASIRFKRGVAGGYYLQKLNELLRQHLSPWGEEARNNVTIGGKINANSVLNFIESQPYIEFVTGFSIEQLVQQDGSFTLIDTAAPGSNKVEIECTTPWSILVSAEQHRFTVLNDRNERDPTPAGLEHVRIGEDFIIPKDPVPLKLQKSYFAYEAVTDDEGAEDNQFIVVVKID